MREPHAHPHYVPCPVLSGRNTTCALPCGHVPPHASGGESWDDDGHDILGRVQVRPAAAEIKPSIREQLLDLASELARLAVAMPPGVASVSPRTIFQSPGAYVKDLLAGLPKCTETTDCHAIATWKTIYPLESSGECPHVCDAHRLTVKYEPDWEPLPYAAAVRELLRLFEAKSP